MDEFFQVAHLGNDIDSGQHQQHQYYPRTQLHACDADLQLPPGAVTFLALGYEHCRTGFLTQRVEIVDYH
jgi:hypothetical protein